MLRTLLVCALALGAIACDSPSTTSDAGPPDSGPGDSGPTWVPACTEPAPPTCVDESILQLALYTDPNPATIQNTADGEGWASHVDATGGGFSPTLSYVYARFTDEGSCASTWATRRRSTRWSGTSRSGGS
ncbi:MAG: hypothetical protein M5U28_03890 [Sandaracinaceae bacterium]|nr:hypothetical protein [Sandaracinaceae bacterium]